MASAFTLKPTHKAVKGDCAAPVGCADQGVGHVHRHVARPPPAVCPSLGHTGRKVGWTLIPELPLDAGGRQIRPDGTFRDEFTIERGYWEAKDTDDDLEAEIKKKIKRGYHLRCVTNAGKTLRWPHEGPCWPVRRGVLEPGQCP